MATSPVTTSAIVAAPTARGSLRVAVAFFAIYVLWGSTYFSIRTVVATVPPLLAAGIRFFIAGAALYGWARARGVSAPSRREWRNLTILGALMFVAAYSGLFWAEKTIASGVASLLVATIPIFTAVLEIFVFKRERLHATIVVSILLGIGGVSLLVLGGGVERLQVLPCLAILGSELCWSLGSVLTKGMALPESKILSAGGQMLTGGLMLLAISAVAGNFSPFPHLSRVALGALLYLIVIGSIVAFTAYVWLLGRMPVTTVASYAYVNPVVALGIGYWLGNETIGWHTIAGAALVLASVVLVLLKRSPAH